MVVIGLEVGLSLVWLMASPSGKLSMQDWLAATPENVFHRHRVWTLATGVFLEPQFIQLVLHAVVMWSFVPTLERFWGTARFYRFFALTSLAGTIVGTTVGLLLGQDGNAITGLDPFIWATIVAFGIVYAKQPVQLFGVMPLTGRQLMYGFLAFVTLLVVLEQMWANGAAFAAAMLVATALTAKRWSPLLAWKRSRIAKARKQLTVLEGGAGRPPGSKPPRDEHKWLN